MTEAKQETIRVLQEARARIERGWTQGVNARDSNGDRAYANDPTAVRWCASGAIHASGSCVCSYLENALGVPEITEWNDAPGRTQAEVLAAFQKAIELAEAEDR